MKIRNGFVSNSSSSSFVIKNKEDLNKLQIHAIYNHIDIANEVLGMDASFSDEWTVTEEEDYIVLNTSMDNFDMSYFLKEIGIPENSIEEGSW